MLFNYKGGNLPVGTTWIKPKSMTLSEISQSKETNTEGSHMYNSKKKKMNSQKYKEIKSRLLVTKGGGNGQLKDTKLTILNHTFESCLKFLLGGWGKLTL